MNTVRHILAGFQQDGLGYTDYLNSTPISDEAVVRLKIVEPLLAALGYDLQADAISVMLWELKRTQETDLARHEDQLTRYTLFQGVAHAVLCNGREVRVYQRVGEELGFAYTFPLAAFAPGALVPPTGDEQLALPAFFDAFCKQAFLEAEAQVHNLIYAARAGAPPKRHKVKRYKAVAPAPGERDIKTLPAFSQSKWGKQIFRSAHKLLNAHNRTLDRRQVRDQIQPIVEHERIGIREVMPDERLPG